MTDWYRNTEWNSEIAEAFEARLARSRSQKAQYLRIQGVTLASSHPDVAIDLLERCASIGDDFETAPALASIATIWLGRGELEPALAALERATIQEERVPDVSTNAPRDFCFLVTLHEQTDRYDRALRILRWLPPVSFGAAGYARNGALAVILFHRNETEKAAAHAEQALSAALDRETPLAGKLTMHPDAIVKQIDNPFTKRLLKILEAGKGRARARRLRAVSGTAVTRPGMQPTADLPETRRDVRSWLQAVV